MVTSYVKAEQVRRAEIKVAAFVVEHNLPFQLMDHLSDLVTDIFQSETPNIHYLTSYLSSTCKVF